MKKLMLLFLGFIMIGCVPRATIPSDNPKFFKLPLFQACPDGYIFEINPDCPNEGGSCQGYCIEEEYYYNQGE